MPFVNFISLFDIMFLKVMVVVFSLASLTRCYKNPYQVLGVASVQNMNSVTQQYQLLIQKYHSDQEKLNQFKVSYEEILFTRSRIKDYQNENVIEGIYRVGKDCSMAIIVFYAMCLLLYYVIELFCFLISLTLRYIFSLIFTNFLLDTFFCDMISLIWIQAIITILISICLVKIYEKYFMIKKNQIEFWKLDETNKASLMELSEPNKKDKEHELERQTINKSGAHSESIRKELNQESSQKNQITDNKQTNHMFKSK